MSSSAIQSALDEHVVPARSLVVIGNFDGVHIGHQTLIESAVDDAERAGVATIALTFEPHPVTWFRGIDPTTFRLSDRHQKRALLLELGVSEVVVLPFGEELVEMTPEDFVEVVLHEGLAAGGVCVGWDFRFGKGRAGTPDVLTSLTRARGIDCRVHEPVDLHAEVVSSTRIRNALKAANLELAKTLTRRPHTLAGTVVKGDARGRGMGFPTLNLFPEAGLLVPYGVYITTLRHRGQALPAISNIGVRPTVSDEGRCNVETFVLEGLDLDEELYGERVEVSLHEFVRPEQTFDSVDGLVAQISHDVEQARAYHRNP